MEVHVLLVIQSIIGCITQSTKAVFPDIVEVSSQDVFTEIILPECHQLEPDETSSINESVESSDDGSQVRSSRVYTRDEGNGKAGGYLGLTRG